MATIRTHTTLRTLFATTTVFALLAAAWMYAPTNHLFHFIVTPCAIVFVAGLFGFSFGATFCIALVTAFAVHAFSVAMLRRDAPPEWGMSEALNNVPSVALWSVAPWWTAWWWGLYLRYVWSNPAKPLEPRVQEGDDPHKEERLTLRERMLVRCEGAPVAFFIITVLANIYVLFIFHWLVNSVRHR